MKKFLVFLSVALLTTLSVTSSFAGEGEQDDSQTFCSSVNDQKHEAASESDESAEGKSGSQSTQF